MVIDENSGANGVNSVSGQDSGALGDFSRWCLWGGRALVLAAALAACSDGDEAAAGPMQVGAPSQPGGAATPAAESPSDASADPEMVPGAPAPSAGEGQDDAPVALEGTEESAEPGAAAPSEAESSDAPVAEMSEQTPAAEEMPMQPAPPEQPPAFAPCPTDGSPCRIMPLGDSITDGIDQTIGYQSNGGYRLELFRQAVLAGHDITFVGSRPPNGPTGDVEGQPFPRSHEGISGNTIAQVAARVDAALAAGNPDIVLLHIGTNNLYQGLGAGVTDQLARLVDQITEGAPDALVVVAQITPLGGSFPNNGVPAYNAAIPAMLEERVAAGKHLMLVDMFSPIAANPNFAPQILPDNIHPNAMGYAIMGRTWYEAIESLLP